MMQQRLSRRALAALTILISLSTPLPLAAGGRRRAVASPSPSAPSITFVDAGGEAEGDAVIDAGTIRNHPHRGSSPGVSVRAFGIRIGPATQVSSGTVALRAFLDRPDPHCKVRIDGILLGSTPRLIDAHAPIGIVTSHTLEIEVPRDAPEGAVVSTILWEAE